MSIFNFDKNSLGNLEYSLKRELLSTNRAGGYLNTTLVCCNTRKYHGLMVAPKDAYDDKRYVLLSSLDETVIQHEQSFNLALHRYPGVYEPRGHKYITDFVYTPTPTLTYRVGGVILTKQLLWIHSSMQLLIKYTLVEAHSETKLRLRPFLAFRDSHSLSKANMDADTRSYPIDGGVRNKMYDGLPSLYLQVNKKHEFIVAPDWYKDFEYPEEIDRGYPAHEDLLTTGYFELDIKKGESVIFSASTAKVDPKKIKAIFDDEVAKRSDKVDFLSCLRHSARQFIVRNELYTDVIAGYPWFGRWGRDTFISLPGITLAQGNTQDCVDVIDSLCSQMDSGLFPNMGTAYNSVDAPLWFFWTLQQLSKELGADAIWAKYGTIMKDIISSFVGGIANVIAVHDNGLVWASSPTHAMTWMDAMVDGVPVTGRDGYQVEINALWYNALCYTLALARKAKDKEFIAAYKDLPAKVKESFLSKFMLKEGYLADYVDNSGASEYIRPNQIIACSLEYRMLDDDQMLDVVNTVTQHLLTPRGLRTLSPRNIYYEGRYYGNQPSRDKKYHQGTVWVWLLEHYVQANFLLSGKDYIPTAKDLLEGFVYDISSAGIASISEIYDADPPHAQRGAISQAWSVGALLRINQMIEEYTKKRKRQ
ncbi:MAG: amylo-alpha-1,6-glucosidase [Rikenellaceae bacterium]